MYHRFIGSSNTAAIQLLVLTLAILMSARAEESLQFSIQPPQTIDCNPINATVVLVCGVTQIQGSNDRVTIQWMYNDNNGNTKLLNHTSAIRDGCCDYIEVAVYEGLARINEIENITGRYWCMVTNGIESLLSNTLIIDHDTDYTMLDDCENVLIEKLHETKISDNNCNQYVNGFASILTIETIGVLVLIISNVTFIFLWYKAKKDKKEIIPERVTRRIKTKPAVPQRSEYRLSDSDKYETILMSVTDIRKPDPEYVTVITPDTSSAKYLSTSTFGPTKVVDGKLYAIANPNLREESKHYEKPNIHHV